MARAQRGLRVVRSEDEEVPVKVALEEMSEDVLFCREQHLWIWKGDTTTTRRGYLIEFTRRHECDRCTAWKEVTREVPSFAVTRRSSNYPHGFLHDGGRLLIADVLREQQSRAGYKMKQKEAD